MSKVSEKHEQSYIEEVIRYGPSKVVEMRRRREENEEKK